MDKGKEEPASGLVTINGELPAFQGEALASSYQEIDGATVSFDFFKGECKRRGHSVNQVLKAIKDGTLPILTPDQKRIPVPTFLNETNLLAYLAGQDTIFPELHAQSFWRRAEGDNGGGWDEACDVSDSSLSVETFLKLQAELSQSIKDRDIARLELDEAKKKMKSRPRDVKRWKDSITAIVAGFIQEGLTEAERHTIITRLQGETRADIENMWADSLGFG